MTSSGSALLKASSLCRSLRLSRLPALIGAFALVLFLGACQDDEERLASFLERGANYVEEGQDEEAIIEFKNVLQIDPENAAAHEALSLAFLRVNKPREAYWEMSETVRLDPENVEARLRYGTISAAIGDFDLSLEQAEAVLEREPANPRGFTLRAQARENREDFEGAEADFKAAVEAEPSAAAFHFLLGGYYERRDDLVKAEATYRELIAVEESYLATSALVRVLSKVGSRESEIDESIARMVELAEAAPREPLVPESGEDRGTTSLMGNVLREDALRGAYTASAARAYDAGDFDKAIALLEEGVSKSESKVELLYQMSSLYRAKGREAEADAMILRASEEAPENASAQLVLSARLGQQGDLEGALEAARAAVKADPESVPAQLREAELLVDVGFRDSAVDSIAGGRAIVDRVLETNPTSPEANFVKAKIELAENDFDSAKKSLETTLQARPDWAQARFVLGSTLAATGEITRARVELESAVENDPGLLDARKLLTQVYSELGEHEFAIEQGRSYLEQRPGDGEIRIVVGQSLIRVGRGEEAYKEVSAIPEENRDAAANFALGRLDLAFGRIEEGAAKLAKADEMSPGNPQVLRSLLAIDRRNEDLEASKARVARALEAAPEDSEIIELDGDLKLSLGDVAGGKQALEKAVQMEPRNVSAQLSLADLARREGKLDEMATVIERAATAVPESSELQYRLAQAYEFTERRPDAINAYEKAISLNGDLAMAKNNLAYLLAESGGDLDRALELAQQAKEQLPDDGNAADTLGWVLLKRGVPSAAIGYLEEASERFPANNPEVQGIVANHLSQAYEANGEPDKAIAEGRKAIEFFEKLAGMAKEQGVDFSEPDWSTETRARIARLESAS